MWTKGGEGESGESSHLSACSASLALCTNSSFSVMVKPERWRLKVVPRLLSVTGPSSEPGGSQGGGRRESKWKLRRAGVAGAGWATAGPRGEGCYREIGRLVCHEVRAFRQLLAIWSALGDWPPTRPHGLHCSSQTRVRPAPPSHLRTRLCSSTLLQ